MFNNTIFGLIYLIKHKTCDTKKVYVGSTNNFKRRISKHRHDCNNEKNKVYNYNLYKYIRENGGFNEYEFIILECYVCNFKYELYYREDDYIQMYDNNLNTFRAYLTDEEHKNKNNEINKKYYDKNKKIISQKNKEKKITCECGAIVRKDSITRHLKSLKHIAFIEQKNNVIL